MLSLKTLNEYNPITPNKRGAVRVGGYRDNASNNTDTSATECSNMSRPEPDYYVTPEGNILPAGEDYNLVSTSTPTNQGGEYFQIHGTHSDGASGAPHTHRPEVHTDPVTGRTNSNRVTNSTSAEDIDYADYVMRNGFLRTITNRSDVGGY